MRVLNELVHFLVDDLRGAFRVRAGLQPVVIVLGVRVIPLDGAKLRGEAIFEDHLACDLCGFLNIVRRAGGRVVEHDFLGGTPTHRVRHLVEQLIAGLGIAVRSRHDRRVAEGPASRQNRHLGHRVGVVHARGDQGVAALMVGGVAQLIECHALGLALRTRLHTIDGLVDGTVVNQLGTGTGAQQRGLVEHVRQISACEAGCTYGDHMQVDVRHERLTFGVNLQNRLTAFQIRGFDRDLTVETAWTQQSRIKHIGAVGRGNDDQIRVIVETIHLNEQLVQGLLTLIMPAAHTGATFAADSVDLVDEDDRRSVLLRLIEQFAHTGGAKADEHLDEVGA